MSVVVVPSRSTTTSICWPALSRMAVENSSQLDIGSPSRETIVSPTWKPALRAGETGSGSGSGATRQVRSPSLAGITQSETWLTVRVAFGIPMPMKTTLSRNTASTTFIIGPPDMTITFFHQDWR